MLEDIMSKEMFDDFVYDRMDLAEQRESHIKAFEFCMKRIKGELQDFVATCGKQYYLAGFRDGQAVSAGQGIEKGGLPREELPASETPQS